MIPNRRTASTVNCLITVSVLVPFAALGLLSVPGTGQKQTERLIKILADRNSPVEITEVKVKGTAREAGKKFASDKDWLEDIVITVKNVSTSR